MCFVFKISTDTLNINTNISQIGWIILANRFIRRASVFSRPTCFYLTYFSRDDCCVSELSWKGWVRQLILVSHIVVKGTIIIIIITEHLTYGVSIFQLLAVYSNEHMWSPRPALQTTTSLCHMSDTSSPIPTPVTMTTPLSPQLFAVTITVSGVSWVDYFLPLFLYSRWSVMWLAAPDKTGVWDCIFLIVTKRLDPLARSELQRCPNTNNKTLISGLTNWVSE